MSQWKYSPDGISASRTTSDGRFESRLVSAIPASELATAFPADPPALQQVKDRLTAVAQKLLDDKARFKNYDDARSCISYLSSSSAAWKADATAMSAWRDAVWTWCFANQASVTAATTDAQFTASLLVACPAPW